MKSWAGERIDELKSRGFENAGLYDPAGVSGTHVMYVLHHADEAVDLRRSARQTGRNQRPLVGHLEGRC